MLETTSPARLSSRSCKVNVKWYVCLHALHNESKTTHPFIARRAAAATCARRATSRSQTALAKWRMRSLQALLRNGRLADCLSQRSPPAPQIPAQAALELLKYDASAVGNHDFDARSTETGARGLPRFKEVASASSWCISTFRQTFNGHPLGSVGTRCLRVTHLS